MNKIIFFFFWNLSLWENNIYFKKWEIILKLTGGAKNSWKEWTWYIKITNLRNEIISNFAIELNLLLMKHSWTSSRDYERLISWIPGYECEVNFI